MSRLSGSANRSAQTNHCLWPSSLMPSGNSIIICIGCGGCSTHSIQIQNPRFRPSSTISDQCRDAHGDSARQLATWASRDSLYGRPTLSRQTIKAAPCCDGWSPRLTAIFDTGSHVDSSLLKTAIPDQPHRVYDLWPLVISCNGHEKTASIIRPSVFAVKSSASRSNRSDSWIQACQPFASLPLRFRWKQQPNNPPHHKRNESPFAE